MHGRAEKLRMQFFDQPRKALLAKTRSRVRLQGHAKLRLVHAAWVLNPLAGIKHKEEF
jgi:hypothetical protein